MMRRLTAAQLVLRPICCRFRLITTAGSGYSSNRAGWQQPHEAMLPFTTVVGVDEAAETSVQLRSLPEVVSAEDLASKGLHSQAVPLLERAADICSAMGSESALARAARRRLALVLYDDQRFSAVETTLTRGRGSDVGSTLPVEKSELLLLSKAQLFQGKIVEAVTSCSRAVELCERDENNTPDTDALGQALRQLGAMQMLLEGAGDDAETSLLRAARLGSSGTDHGKGLSVLATFNACSGDRQRIEEAVELWDEARAATKPRVDPSTKEKGESNGATASPGDTVIINDVNAAAIAHARASVLCSAAQGELLLERGTEKALEYLWEAVDTQKEVLPTGHPATLWALTLLGRCFLLNEDAVVAEGLFRSAVDGFAGGRLEAGPVLFPSPLHPFSEAYAMRALWDLLRMWDKRESEAKQVLGNVKKVENLLPLKPPGGATIHMLHLDDIY